ncbi:REP-associated tyrosine transposase [Psychrobacter sp. H7-1]|uniref:REP-associated tyrosine transposase n=1 Tax=Psychrobacter sp. H7-1 TaxID=1569265 RepID=UPI00223436A4|nr:transposase [Psychrobacter sp. H7-1]
MQYRRYYKEGASYFFTINLADRSSDLLIKEVAILREAFRTVKKKHPFHIDAIVILPDHLHLLCTLPNNDSDFSKRIRLIKYYFSYHIAKTEPISISRQRKSERGIWQRRFWEHCIRDEADYIAHINYIHMNPVKHGHVEHVKDWKYSSFHKFVAQNLLPIDWGG